jgi:hypothetical protein
MGAKLMINSVSLTQSFRDVLRNIAGSTRGLRVLYWKLNETPALQSIYH